MQLGKNSGAFRKKHPNPNGKRYWWYCGNLTDMRWDKWWQRNKFLLYDEAWRRMKMWTSPYFSGGDGTGVLWVSVSGAWQSIRHGVVLFRNHCVKRKLRFQNGSRWNFRVNHSMSKCFIHCPFSEWVSQRGPCILRKSSIKSTNLIMSTS